MTEIKALTVPKWGMAMEEGTLVNWLVAEGDRVNPGDPIAEIESSKIVNVLETQYPGVVRRRMQAADETLPVGALVAVIADAAVPESAIDAFIADFKIADEVIDMQAESTAETGVTAVAPSPATGAATVAPDRLKQGGDDSSVNASPHARRLAQDLGINLNNITGSGRRGRISVDDIELAIVAAGGSLRKPPVEGGGAEQLPAYEEIPFTGMRETIARRLQVAKQTAPHYRLNVEVEVDTLLALREEINKAADPACPKVSINDLLLKACALALMQTPECNVQFADNVIRRFRHADIALAVALGDGLITPVLRRVETKSIAEIAAESRSLAAKARAGTLARENYEGGSFTISNLGMYGVRSFDAIINPPQCAILAVGAARPGVVAREGVPAVATLIALSLSLDHRIIDGATGARLLKALTEIIRNPIALNT
ncbi:MAG TPA: dihydrolipoamide acetyltransferase family protein [Gammaproteobacteria bacterium]|nr:dihydrolipoamide acetyltransferase family protein [Gammaproteobacteria bacterium]